MVFGVLKGRRFSLRGGTKSESSTHTIEQVVISTEKERYDQLQRIALLFEMFRTLKCTEHPIQKITLGENSRAELRCLFGQTDCVLSQESLRWSSQLHRRLAYRLRLRLLALPARQRENQGLTQTLLKLTLVCDLKSKYS